MEEVQYNNKLRVISLCPVEAKDNEFLLRIFKESRPDLDCINGISENQKAGIILQQFKLEQQQLKKMYINAEFNIVKLDEEPIGRLYIHHGQASERIVQIGLLEEYRSLGIGGKLMKSVIENTIKERKILCLQVAWFNQMAMVFYERLGFRITENKGVFYEMQYEP